jgi:voltage-gated potassium channel
MVREFLAAHVGLLAEFAGVLGAIAVVIVVAAGVIARFDRVPLEDAIYFAFITAFTVGFGDVAPRSRGARAVSVILAFLGLILVGIVVAIAVHALDAALKSAAAPGL